MDRKYYENIETKISSRGILRLKSGKPINAPKFYTLKKWLGSNPLIQRLARKITACSMFHAQEQRTAKSIALLNVGNGHDAHVFGSPYGYEDDLHELQVAMQYARQIKEGFEGPSESEKLYAHLDSILTNLLSKLNIPTCLNFGVGYAYIDSLLAAKFPKTQFIGIDRSRLTKAYNEMHFSHLKNLHHVAGDIFQFLDENKNMFDGGVFFHARTILLLPKSFIEKLYEAVAKAKFQYIVSVEQIGISRQTLQSYRFSEEDQPSVVYRETMFIHNYPALLKNAGFSISRAELVKTDHPHEDYRFFSITAKRNP